MLKGDGEVFFWDGKTEKQNPGNIDLWQEIIERAARRSVLVYITEQNNKKAFVIVSPKDVEGTNTIRAYGLIAEPIVYSSSNGDAIDGILVEAVINRDSSNKVTSVMFAHRLDVSGHFLPTDKNIVKDYTPTYDYHPATKKYVDDVIGKNPAIAVITYNSTIQSNIDALDNLYANMVATGIRRYYGLIAFLYYRDLSSNDTYFDSMIPLEHLEWCTEDETLDSNVPGTIMKLYFKVDNVNTLYPDIKRGTYIVNFVIDNSHNKTVTFNFINEEQLATKEEVQSVASNVTTIQSDMSLMNAKIATYKGAENPWTISDNEKAYLNTAIRPLMAENNVIYFRIVNQSFPGAADNPNMDGSYYTDKSQIFVGAIGDTKLYEVTSMAMASHLFPDIYGGATTFGNDRQIIVFNDDNTIAMNRSVDTLGNVLTTDSYYNEDWTNIVGTKDNVFTPTQPQQPASKKYVDGLFRLVGNDLYINIPEDQLTMDLEVIE